MAEYNKQRFYWIKLTDHFLTSETVDFLLSQKNGANYVVLYQMLCLKAVNSNGLLARQIGEIIVPYDAEKIQRDCKHFDIDTVRVALELYKKLGLVYEQQDGILQITDFDRLIGSQTESAFKKMEQRRLSGQKSGQKVDICPPEIKILRDKDIEEKDSLTRVEKERQPDKPSSPSPKHKYGVYKNVLLTEKEYQSLIELQDGEKAIEFLSEYRAYKGYKAKSDFLAIKKWVFEAMSERRVSRNPARNFTEREYTKQEIGEIFGNVPNIEDYDI